MHEIRQILLYTEEFRGDESRQMFIGRKNELEALNAFYEGDKEALACVTGALGMGKTTLALELSKMGNSFYSD